MNNIMSFVKFLITLFYIITIFILEDFILYTMLTDDIVTFITRSFL